MSPLALRGSQRQAKCEYRIRVLLAQPFSSAKYFHAQPLTVGANGYDASNSGGTNRAPTNQKLIDRVKDGCRSPALNCRQFGFLGEPRINVLELNLALDERYPAR